MKHTTKCTECPKTFTHKTQQKAEQALAMHVGRMHKGNIKRPVEHEHTGVLRQSANGDLAVAAPPVSTGRRGSRSHLTGEQTDGIVSFIRTNKKQYESKAACLTAALESVGAAGQIIVNGTAVDRYFKKAAAGPGGKRPYTRRLQAQPVKAEVQINFCPCCGFNMQALATGMAMAAHMK